MEPGLDLLRASPASKSNGQAGDDCLTIDSSISVPARVDGGAGNDKIVGGSGADTLLGGDGP